MKYFWLPSWLTKKLLPCLLFTGTLMADPFTYVCNNISTDVSVIDVATDAVISTIPLGGSNFDPWNIVIAPDNSTAFLTSDTCVQIIDVATNTLVGSPIAVGNSPRQLVITPDGAKIYVVCNVNPTSISIIDVATRTTIGTLSVSAQPYGIAITPDGSTLYIGLSNSTVVRFDVATDTPIGSPINMSGIPNFIGITPNGTKAYACVSDPFSSMIEIIDVLTNTVIGNITGIFKATSLAFTPDGSKAYSTDALNSVYVIDLNTDTIIGSPILVGNQPQQVVITPDGTKAYVTNTWDGTVSVIDLATNTVAYTINVGQAPWGLAIANPFPPPVPPSKFIGIVKRHAKHHSSKIRTQLYTRWPSSVSPNICEYEIFAFSKKLASIKAAAHRKFKKRLHPHVGHKKLPKKYFHYLMGKYCIRSVAFNGATSPFTYVTVTRHRGYHSD